FSHAGVLASRTLETSNSTKEHRSMSKLLLPLLLVGLMLTTGCHHGRHHEVAGSGTRVTQKRNVSSFTSIAIEGAFTLEVVCQKDLSLELEGDDNILPLVSTD